MLKAFFAFLLVLAALSGSLYAFHGSKKGKKRQSSEDASQLQRFEPYFSPQPGVPPTPSHHALAISPHAIAVIVAAVVLGSAAYLGLGQTLEASAVPTSTTDAAVFDATSLRDDVRPATWHSAAQLSAPAVSADLAPAPTPVVAAETQIVTPAPTDAPALDPTAAPAPAPAAEAPTFDKTYAPGSIEAMICAMPWPCGEAISVAQCESGTDRNGNLDGNWATNGNHFGLFQIAGLHAPRWADFWDAWMDPQRNIQYAYDIWSESGWRPWSCRPY